MGGIFMRLRNCQKSRDFQLLGNAAVNRVLPIFHSVFPLSITPRPSLLKSRRALRLRDLWVCHLAGS